MIMTSRGIVTKCSRKGWRKVKIDLRILGLAAALSLGLAIRTSAAEQPAAGGAKAKPGAKAEDKKEGHDHSETGPHGGPIIELGEEEYHGEIVLEDKTKTVTIYLLGSNAKDAVPIDAPEVVINLKHGNKPEQFKLKASPTKTDPKGKASRFVLKSDDLLHDLHHDNADARLRVKIAGKSYSGKIAAGHHDHADHAEPGKKKS